MTGPMWVTADTAEIDGLAAELETARVNATTALADLRVARLRTLGVSETPDGARLRALTALSLAMGAVGAVHTRMVDRTAALRLAAREYDGAESVPSIDAGLVGLLGAVNPLAPGVALGSILAGVAWSAVTGDPLLPASRSARLVELLGVDDLARLTQIVSPYLPAGYSLSLGAGPLGVPLPSIGSIVGPTRIVLEDPGEPLAPAAAGSLADVADRVRLVDAEAVGDTAVVDIQKIEHVDGTVSWTVAVHGTKGWNVAQPFGSLQNVGAYTGWGSAGESMVLSAMAKAGIGPGQPVLLAGHSQGGMTMTRLANNREMQQRFAVAGVVTFGAPVAHMAAPPAGVTTMNVQHAEEGVAALSGGAGSRDGGPAPNEVVVVRELAGTGADISGVNAHDMPNYVETAAMLESQPHPALGDWEEGMSPLLAEPGATVTATTYRGTIG